MINLNSIIYFLPEGEIIHDIISITVTVLVKIFGNGRVIKFFITPQVF